MVPGPRTEVPIAAEYTVGSKRDTDAAGTNNAGKSDATGAPNAGKSDATGAPNTGRFTAAGAPNTGRSNAATAANTGRSDATAAANTKRPTDADGKPDAGGVPNSSAEPSTEADTRSNEGTLSGSTGTVRPAAAGNGLRALDTDVPAEGQCEIVANAKTGSEAMSGEDGAGTRPGADDMADEGGAAPIEVNAGANDGRAGDPP